MPVYETSEDMGIPTDLRGNNPNLLKQPINPRHQPPMESI